MMKWWHGPLMFIGCVYECVIDRLRKTRTFLRRVIRFCIGYPYVLLFGTFSHLDPEGRSVRLGWIEAAKYAWSVAQ